MIFRKAETSETLTEKIGNKIFAIETNLDPLERRIMDGRVEEAIEILKSIRISVDHIKQLLPVNNQI